ncbi:MAG TPA: rhodanese-like domain-containing protein [Rhodocyclaceae bacterium]|nr:rhodanese-like domain-containing protein [Rhodocyclaceae bacterium]
MGRLTEILKQAQARASEKQLPYAGALTPQEAAEVLQSAPGARLVDVRTRAEWDWVGRVPGSVELEWLTYPGSQPNTHFIEQLKHELPTEGIVLFMCRSGVRSSAAAKAATEAGYTSCYNVLEGFEGDKDANNQRNKVNGWRAAGLPWMQG